MDDRVIIEARHTGAKISLIFWIAEGALAVFFAGLGVYWLFIEAWVGIVLIGGSLLLFVVAVIVMSTSRNILALRAPAIEISAEGLIDRRISEQRIPWSSLEWRIVFTGKSDSLCFDIDAATAATLKPRFAARASAMLSRLFGLPAYTIVTLGAGKSVQEIGDMLTRFKPPGASKPEIGRRESQG